MTRSLSYQRRGSMAMLASAAFALGVGAATVIGLAERPVGGAHAAIIPPGSAIPPPPGMPTLSPSYPAEVIRVIDGDTFEARVRVWPGMDITTRVRLRGIDTPELRARCPQERAKAEDARAALVALLARGRVGINHVGLDKYGGRVVADASSADAASVAEALLAAGHARRYDGGRRRGWCGHGS
jgi:endonuclease YncB( thermonuclease family)